ncbi:hypothetical protein V3C99_005154 [Haemonchus contortus]|uniref:EKC/KEOPS complex subunit CGI121 n=1 Tax=Haemonchus contortus TaxID=6289 RepID=A0A7I4XVI2_HAECO
MVDTFLPHAFYNNIRDAIVEETEELTQADLDYSHGEQYPIFLIVQAFESLHAANRKLQNFNDLAIHPEHWRIAPKLTLRNISRQTTTFRLTRIRSRTLIPHVLSFIEDNKRFVDVLSYFSVTHANIKLLCTTASAANLKSINVAIARLRDIFTSRSSSAQTTEFEGISATQPLHQLFSRRQSVFPRKPPSNR